MVGPVVKYLPRHQDELLHQALYSSIVATATRV